MLNFVLVNNDPNDLTFAGMREYFNMFGCEFEEYTRTDLIAKVTSYIQSTSPLPNNSLKIIIVKENNIGKDILKFFHTIRSSHMCDSCSFLLISPEPPEQLKDTFTEELGVISMIPLPFTSSSFVSTIEKILHDEPVIKEISSLRNLILRRLEEKESVRDLLSLVEKLAAFDRCSSFYLQYLRARVLEKLGKYKEALVAANAVVKEKPTFLPGWSVLSSIYQKSGNNESAKSTLLNALKVATEHVDYLIGLGDIHFEEGSFKESEAFYRRALKKDSHNQAARSGVVGVALATGQKPQGEDLAYFPSSYDLARISNLKGVQLSQNAQFASAQTLYENALTYLPIADQAHRIFFNLGLMMERAKKFEEAIKYYKESIACAGTNPLEKAVQRLEKLQKPKKIQKPKTGASQSNRKAG